jgi:hypothetical protein
VGRYPNAEGLRDSLARITLAARESPERLTGDLDVRLSSPEGKAATIAGSVLLVETKAERGEGCADQALLRNGRA